LSRKVVIANPRSGAEIDDFALRIIREFQPKVLEEPSPFDIEDFFEFDVEKISGVRPDYKELPVGIHGYTDSDAMETVISSDLMDDPCQKYFRRSTTAHEIGHALIHVYEFRQKKAILKSIHDKQHVSLQLLREADIPVYRNPEWQAWRFAGALLMPAPTIKPAFDEGLSVKALSTLFQVNPAFVKSRLRALKINI